MVDDSECLPCKAKKLELLGSTFPIDPKDTLPTDRNNCLSWNLHFQKKNPDYVIYYNSDHVISLHKSIDPPSTYLPLSEYGFQHLRSSFDGLLTLYEVDLLYDYIDSTYDYIDSSTYKMYEVILTEDHFVPALGVYEFMFDGFLIQIPYRTFRFKDTSMGKAISRLPEDLTPSLIELTS